MSTGLIRTAGCRLAAAIIALSLLAAGARGETVKSERFERLLSGFIEAALRTEDGQPARPRRWQAPLRLRLAGEGAVDFGPTVVAELRRMAAIAGLEIELLSADGGAAENLRIVFEGGSGYRVNDRDAGCYTRTRFDAKGALIFAEVRINTRYAGRNGACAAHELMHALGLPGHPQELRSVLNLVQGVVVATEEDALLLQLLYAPELDLGQPEQQILMRVRALLAARLGLAAPPSPALAPSGRGNR